MIFLIEDEGIDSAWTTVTKNMSPRELHNWRRSLYSIYVGHLPYDITKVFLLLLPINDLWTKHEWFSLITTFVLYDSPYMIDGNK